MADADRDAMQLATVSPAPTGREARLWRVLIELSVQVEEARAAFAREGKPRALVPGRLENIVVEFDDAYTVYVEGMERLPEESQLLALQAVDRQLAGMVRAKDAALWSEQALREDRRWEEAQRMARVAIGAYAWPSRRLELVASEAGGGAARRAASGPGENRANRPGPGGSA
ncbi:hypothetical protein K2X89_16950 [Myxococcota bacterium]|nr:hypothetical protein [Myxococcota bacterium]